MPQLKIWFVAAAAGLVALLLLGKLAMLEPRLQTLRQDMAAAAPVSLADLSDDNLPDAVGSLRLRHRVTRIGWERRRLAIDLLMKDGERQPAALWNDLVSVMRFSFADTGNVRQTLVRVYQEAVDGGRTLMFYGDPRKEDWPIEKLAELQAPQRGEDTLFRKQIGLSATPAGERWLSKV